MKKCANKECQKEFEPRTICNIYCCRMCRLTVGDAKKKARYRPVRPKKKLKPLPPTLRYHDMEPIG